MEQDGISRLAIRRSLLLTIDTGMEMWATAWLAQVAQGDHSHIRDTILAILALKQARSQIIRSSNYCNSPMPRHQTFERWAKYLCSC